MRCGRTVTLHSAFPYCHYLSEAQQALNLGNDTRRDQSGTNRPKMTVATGQRVAALRKLMQEQNLDAYIVPSEDAHASEYVAECDARRAFISGFDGSAGVAIVTEKAACVFTDGRYFNQASHQLDENWTLMKQGMPPRTCRIQTAETREISLAVLSYQTCMPEFN